MGESTEGDLHLVSREEPEGMHVLGLRQPADVLNIPLADLKRSQEVSSTMLGCVLCVGIIGAKDIII